VVERGRPEVPTEWLKTEWRRRGLLKRLQLTLSGCLGPCDVPNVVGIASEKGACWYGNVTSREMYQDILDWASASVAANHLLKMPQSFVGHSIEPFRKDVAERNGQLDWHHYI
jgi:(2Fe-2S) ferredoxin